MISRALGLSRPRRIFSRQFLAAVVLLAFIWVFMLGTDPSSEWRAPLSFIGLGTKRIPITAPIAPLTERVSCYGPRGKLLSDSPDDDLHEVTLDAAYPIPLVGTHEQLGLKTSWMTAEGRYGPYGYGEEEASYKRAKVKWENVDWGKLQNSCFDRNSHRFPAAAKSFENPNDAVRFRFRNLTRIPTTRQWHEFKATRRTAIVLRAYDGFQYKPEDLWYLRSLIVEASLRTGGEYTVILLVDIKNLERNIFASEEAYKKALTDANIPPEFHSIAVLWDEHLLESWYPRVSEHRTMWQVYQPMQLFALHYPEFDHYWQLELDMRFLGDAGKYLDAMSNFALNEPRKQALERSTFMHMQNYIGGYDKFFEAVNTANGGSAHIWGPMWVPEISPIGPIPPTKRPEQDNFKWGVGEEADAIVTSFCVNATTSKIWVFKDWLGGFKDASATTRFFCPPAITRTSRTLLLAVHDAQITKGIYLPSEATPPSFALYHGLKLSYPPQPVYWKKKTDEEIYSGWWKGGPANGTAGLGPKDPGHPLGDGLSFWWESKWPRLVMDSWENGNPESEDFPWLLTAEKDKIYAPNMLMHPVKH